MDTPTQAQTELSQRVVVIATDAPMPEPPKSPSGEPFQFCWLDRDVTVFADSLSDIIGVLVPEYAQALHDRDDRAMLSIRLSTLARFAMIAQERELTAAAEALEEDDPDTSGLPEVVVQMAFLPKDGDVLALDEWPLDDLPLYLLATQYAPYTDVRTPTGKGVVMLSPVTERTYLDSLVLLDFGSLFSIPQSS